MFSHDSPNLDRKMREAREILGDHYSYFEDLIKTYTIKLDTPYWDIACFLIYLKLKKQQINIELWIDFWKSSTKKIRKFGNFQYIIPTSYYHFTVTDRSEKFFHNILQGKHSQTFDSSWERYLYYFFKNRDLIRPTFTQIEFELLKSILDIQSLSNQQLQENGWGDVSNLSKYKNRVLDKGVIFQGLALNIEKLGLASFNFVIKLPIEFDINIRSLFPKNRYLRFIQKNSIGAQVAIANFLAPDKPEVWEDLTSMKISIEEQYSPYSVRLFKLERETKKISFNFNNYNFKKGFWEFEKPLLNLLIETYPLIQKRKKINIRSEFEDYSKEELKLSYTSLKFLNYILKLNHLSERMLIKRADLTKSAISKKLNYLKKSQIIKKRLNPMVVFGLSSIVIILNLNSENQMQLHSFLSVFPEVYSEVITENGTKRISLILRSPQEEVVRSIEIIRKIFESSLSELFIIDQFYSQRLQLPIDKYDTINRDWQYESGELLRDD